MAPARRLHNLVRALSAQSRTSAAHSQSDTAVQPGKSGRHGVGPTRRNRIEMFEQGYTIVDDAVEPQMLERLCEAAERIYAEAAASSKRDLNGGLVLRDAPDQGPHAIRGLVAPGMNAPVFAEYLGSQPVLDYTYGWIGAEKEDLMMPDADCILYCSPMNVDRAQGWHRDFAHWRGDGNHPLGPYSEAAQRERWETLNSSSYWPTPFDPDDPGSGGLFGHNTYIEHNHGAQWVRWELALIDHEVNSGVEYVPGSHRRFRTDFENDVLVPAKEKELLPDHVRALPPGIGASCMTDGQGGESLMPGAQVIQIKKGQTVFWNGDGLHRGRTTKGVPRLSLACGWAGPPAGGWSKLSNVESPIDRKDRSRSGLVQWKLDPEVRKALPTAWMRKTWDRWLETQYYTEKLPESEWFKTTEKIASFAAQSS